MESLIALLVAFFGLIAGSLTDLDRREVPDWINYGLMFCGFGIALILSIVKNDFMFLAYSALGFAIFFIIGLVMYYTGQWGGGDSKMLMGLGALIGIPFAWPIQNTIALWRENPPLLFIFLVMTMLSGAVYGVIWSIVLAIKDKKAFMKDAKKRLSSRLYVVLRYACLGALAIALFIVFRLDDITIKVMILILAIMMPIMLYTSVFIKSVENCCMIKQYSPEKLTEGDWIAEDVVIEGEHITGPKDLGITKEGIARIKELHSQGKIKTVMVKEGIPFVPSFLFGMILALIYLFL